MHFQWALPHLLHRTGRSCGLIAKVPERKQGPSGLFQSRPLWHHVQGDGCLLQGVVWSCFSVPCQPCIPAVKFRPSLPWASILAELAMGKY